MRNDGQVRIVRAEPNDTVIALTAVIVETRAMFSSASDVRIKMPLLRPYTSLRDLRPTDTKELTNSALRRTPTNYLFYINH